MPVTGWKLNPNERAQLFEQTIDELSALGVPATAAPAEAAHG